MSKTPIEKQSGLSNVELENMKPVEQKYSESGDTSLVENGGVETQKNKISNRIHKILSEHYERMKTMDAKDEYSREKELKVLSWDLTNFVCDLVSAQKVEIETEVKTEDVLSGTMTNVQTGATSPLVINGKGEGKGNSTGVIIK